MSKAGDRTYWKMRELISSGALAAGERLREEQIADLCQVSRTPVREALRQLEAEMYVVRQKGTTFVRNWTLDDLKEMCEVRALLEGLAAENAASRFQARDLEDLAHKNLQMLAFAKSSGSLDPIRFRELNLEFHELIWMSGLPSQYSIVRRITEDSIPYGRLNQIPLEIVEKTFAEHEQIIDAIRRGDSRLARDCMSTHIRLGVKVYMETTADVSEHLE